MVENRPGGRVILPHYLVAVRETIKGNKRSEIEALLKAQREVKAHYGTFDRLIAELEAALNKAK